MVTINDDTLFYNLVLHPLLKDPHLVSHVACTSPNSVSIYEDNEIKSMTWQGLEYINISIKHEEINNFPYKLRELKLRDHLLGYYRVKGKVSLIKAGYVDQDLPLSIPIPANYSIRTIYFLEVDNEIIYMSSVKKKQAYLLKTILKDRPSIIAQIRDEGINLFEIVKLLESYNKEAKEQ